MIRKTRTSILLLVLMLITIIGTVYCILFYLELSKEVDLETLAEAEISTQVLQTDVLGDFAYNQFASINAEVTPMYKFLPMVSTRQITITIVPDEAKISSRLKEAMVPIEQPYITYEDGQYKEVAGTGLEFDINNVTSTVKQALIVKETMLSLRDFVTLPDDVTVLDADFSNIEWLNSWHITYDNGYTVTGDLLHNYLNDDYTIDWESVDLTPVLDELETLYDGTSKTVNLTPMTGDSVVSVPYKTYGHTLARQAEEKELLNLMREHLTQEDRTPVLSGYDIDDTSDSWIEISLADQHLWLHDENGDVTLETDVVTGTKNKRDTPTGVFYISERVDGKYLRGDDYVTWVNKWMRLTNGGVGLHDAYWRSSFGGNIYEKDGSHGCINMPKTVAYQLYPLTHVGMRVVIY